MNADRGITPVNAFADGVTGGNVDGAPFDTRVDLDGTVRTASAFATSTTVDPRHVARDAVGALQPDGRHDWRSLLPGRGPGSLNGSYTFNRFNPAAGLTVNPSRNVNLYVGYSEGSRAPTSIELGCADPSRRASCRTRWPAIRRSIRS